VSRLKPTLQPPKNPFDEWPAAASSESPTARKTTTSDRPLTPKSPIRSPRGLSAAATAFDPFASPSHKVQDSGRPANPFEAFPMLPPVPPPVPPPSSSRFASDILGAAAVANAAFDFAEMCTVSLKFSDFDGTVFHKLYPCTRYRSWCLLMCAFVVHSLNLLVADRWTVTRPVERRIRQPKTSPPSFLLMRQVPDTTLLRRLPIPHPLLRRRHRAL